MQRRPYALPPTPPGARQASGLASALDHGFGRAAATLAASGVVYAVFTGVGVRLAGVVVVLALSVPVVSNLVRGFRDLSGTSPAQDEGRVGPALGPPAHRAPEPAPFRDPDGHAANGTGRLAAAVAVVGSAAAVTVLLAFYVPGMLAAGRDVDDVVVLLALPAVALALPFALMAFVRVRMVLVVAGGLLALTHGAAALDLFTGPPDGEGESLFVFALVIVIGFIEAVTALVISAGLRAARRR